MKIVIFGLTVTSSWGNGHATLWRGLCKALARRGHSIVFFEREVPYYAHHRDLDHLEGCWLVVYRDWDETLARVRRELADADVAMTTSFCPDARAAAAEILASRAPRKLFYDLDAPVTLAALAAGERVPYLPEEGLGDFDLVLSYTGGEALAQLRTRLGARRVLPLYGHVDPDAHHPVAPSARFRADLSYLGTYAADREAALEQLFFAPARARSQGRFLLGGAKYPAGFAQLPQLAFVEHVAPPEHPEFFSSSRLTLNVTRRSMAALGHCPSGRLFEAAACGCALVSDVWHGIEAFYRPGEEILLARSSEDVLAALDRSDAELARLARAGRERTLAEHTSMRRALELEDALASSHVAAVPPAPASSSANAMQGWS
jgi:spore maturation protein CgeB